MEFSTSGRSTQLFHDPAQVSRARPSLGTFCLSMSFDVGDAANPVRTGKWIPSRGGRVEYGCRLGGFLRSEKGKDHESCGAVCRREPRPSKCIHFRLLVTFRQLMRVFPGLHVPWQACQRLPGAYSHGYPCATNSSVFSLLSRDSAHSEYSAQCVRILPLGGQNRRTLLWPVNERTRDRPVSWLLMTIPGSGGPYFLTSGAWATEPKGRRTASRHFNSSSTVSSMSSSPISRCLA